jgi:hypothetical protein
MPRFDPAMTSTDQLHEILIDTATGEAMLREEWNYLTERYNRETDIDEKTIITDKICALSKKLRRLSKKAELCRAERLRRDRLKDFSELRSLEGNAATKH